MAKMTLCFVSVEGGDDVVRSVVKTAVETIARQFGIEPAEAPAPAALSPAPPAVAELPQPDAATRGQGDAEIRPSTPAAEDTEIPAPRRPARAARPRKPLNGAGLPVRRKDRRVAVDGRGSYTVVEAAELLGCTAGGLKSALYTGRGTLKGRAIAWADAAAATPARDPESREPHTPTAMASLPAGYRPGPRGDGSATPINPNRVGAGAPVPQDPPRSHGTGWKPRTSEAV
jgi:hypothetical protein